MATGAWSTLVDLASRSAADGQIRVIAEMLSQCNDFPDDLPWVEANEMSGHEFTFRDSIPAGSWRQINQGIPVGKSTTKKARVSMGMLEGLSQIDRKLAEMSGNIQKFRMTEDVAFLEGMGQTMVQTFFYGNTAANPAEFMGLAPFYSSVSTATKANAANVIDAGGTGSSNTSLWLICWGERTIFGTFPRGSKAGLSMEDYGQQYPAYDSVGNLFPAYTAWFRQEAGLCPQDWRNAARIANIDTTASGLSGPNAYDIFAGMAELMLLPPTLTSKASGITKTDAPDDVTPGIRPVLYCNRTLRHWMDVQAIRDRNVLLGVDDYAGKVTMGYRGIPIKVVDQILNSESRVV